ncbi:MAG: M23 family metallopeptidase [Asticcacaulis sp.]
MEEPEPLRHHPALSRRHLCLIAAAASVPATARADLFNFKPFDLSGRFVQGGYAKGTAEPGREIRVDGILRGKTSAKGHFIIGFDRDAPEVCTLEISGEKPVFIDIDKTEYSIQRVDGLPPSTVTPTDPALLQRIARERALKDQAFASRKDADWFMGKFAKPLEKYRISGKFGNQRILNGEPRSPHYGIDLAAPTGTLVYAPQTARVVLAEPNMHFEGGLIFLDHGQGLISMYLHLSGLNVKKDQIVQKGAIIGKVGATGRATGPHLCWRLKWRDRALDPSLLSGI